MRFISPRTDLAFKKIFGSQNSKGTCISFLNAMLDFQDTEKEIVDLEILDPWNAPKIKGLKDTYLDVKVKTIAGEYIIVEMQVLNVDGFRQRILYNTAKTYANQILSGEDYGKLSPVIALTIVDFNLIEESKKYLHTFHIKEKSENFKYLEDFELVFLELPKFTKKLEDLENAKDKWIYFLKEVDDLTTIPETYKKDMAFDEAFNIAETCHISAEELDILERKQIYIADQRNALLKVKREGREEGRQEGIQEGRQEGKKEERINLIKKLSKKMNISYQEAEKILS